MRPEPEVFRMQSKSILILFCKLQVDPGGCFVCLFCFSCICFSKKVDEVSLCFANVNLAGALHKMGLKTNGEFAAQTV